jgi:hypothetical protein
LKDFKSEQARLDHQKITEEQDETYWQSRMEDALEDGNKAPGFESYYDSKAKGQHPFDDKTKYPEQSVDSGDFDHLVDSDGEDVWNGEELQGKLYNQTMTSKQFDQWTKMTTGDDDKLKKMQEGLDRELYLNGAEMRRIYEEEFESFRRRKVLNKEWTEGESKVKL